MSDWNHLICDDCWEKQNPNREPRRIKDLNSQHCCFCGNPTLSGIWVRNNPKDEKLACKGVHND